MGLATPSTSTDRRTDPRKTRDGDRERPDTPTIPREILEEKLAYLGDTADEVAALLAGEGTRGLRGSGTGCPLAAYLNEAVGVRVDVGSATIQGVDGTFWVPLPRPLMDFVARFDDGRYPHLIDDGPDDADEQCVAPAHPPPLYYDLEIKA